MKKFNQNKIKNMKISKSTFRIDEITLVFIVAVVAMIAVIYGKTGNEMEAEKITDMILDNHGISFANNGVIDENKLKEIQKMDYDDFKDSVNAKNDFCVYVEDGNGGVILAKGSAKLSNEEFICRE